MLWLTALVINEVARVDGDSGWVEVYNEGQNVVDLGPYSVRTEAATYDLSGVLAGGEYRVFYVRLGNSSGRVSLLLNGEVVDSCSWVSLPTRGSIGRIPDGTGDFRVLIRPTPGRSNDLPASLDEQSWGRIKALFGPGKRR